MVVLVRIEESQEGSRSQGMSPRRCGTTEVSPTSSSRAVKITDWFRCSDRKVARGGLNAEGGIVGGDNANWVFE
jgi:hypothetical protein